MINVIPMPKSDERYDEASRWVAKLDNELSADERRALQRWMAADPENRKVLLELAALWDRMDSMSRLAELFPARTHNRGTRVPHRALAAAAVVAVCTGIVAFLASDPDKVGDRQGTATAATWEDTYETAIGEHSTVTLPDSSQVILNTNSLVRVNYTAEHRRLTLERGEVHVLVGKDHSRPLSVVVGGNVVQALGTEFNIEITGDQRIELVVTEGVVRVGLRQSQSDNGKISTPVAVLASSVRVAAGEALVLGEPTEEITKVSAEEIEVRLSWRNGNLIFRGESLEEAVKEIGRYTSVEFVILDDELKKVRVAGLFKAGDVDGLLAALRENFDIAYQRVDDQTVLLDSQ